MTVATVLLQAALWIWFLGCTFTYRFAKILLVEGMGFKSIEFAMLCIYTAGVAAFHFLHPAGRWILLAVLCVWLLSQFRWHWYYTLFGASEQKLKGYNNCFRGTVRIFPENETRLVPDLYHILLHLLIFLNIILCICGSWS